MRHFRGGAWAGRRTSGGSRPRHSGRRAAFHFEPLERDARHTVRLRQRVHIRFLAAVDAGAEEAHRVGLDDFVRAEKDFHFLDGGLGREVERGQRAGLTGALGVHADGFVAAAGPDFVGIGAVVGGLVQVSHLFRAETDVVPVVDATAAHPDRVALAIR